MTNSQEWGAVVLRFVLGVTFLVHGIVKFQGGIENIAGWFASIGLPGGLAYVVALLEVVGGIALMVGLGVKIVSALLALVMIGAIFKVKIAIGFLGNGQMAGYELDLALLAIAVYLALNGSRMMGLDSLFTRKK